MLGARLPITTVMARFINGTAVVDIIREFAHIARAPTLTNFTGGGVAHLNITEYYSSTYGLSTLYFRTITYTCMHACARALHDAVKASTPVERNFLQLGPGPFLGWGRRFRRWYCYRKTNKKSKKNQKKSTVQLYGRNSY